MTRLLETRSVSRKTPGDGKLEITTQTALALGGEGPLSFQLAGQTTDGVIGTMPCTCRGIDTPHVHYFIQHDRLRSLSAGTSVDIKRDDANGVVIDASTASR